LQAHQIDTKAQGEIVTQADIHAEQRLTRHLTNLVPGSCVVGEENTARDHTILDLLESDRPVWIVDPVDGTHNFAHGKPRFCVIVALSYRQTTLAGWIFEPIADRSVYAAREKGA